MTDFRSLFEHILERVDWQRDLHIFSQTAFDTLDYASGKVNFGDTLKGTYHGAMGPSTAVYTWDLKLVP